MTDPCEPADRPLRRGRCGCLAFVVCLALLAVFWPIVLGGAIFALATLQVLLERLL